MALTLSLLKNCCIILLLSPLEHMVEAFSIRVSVNFTCISVRLFVTYAALSS